MSFAQPVANPPKEYAMLPTALPVFGWKCRSLALDFDASKPHPPGDRHGLAECVLSNANLFA